MSADDSDYVYRQRFSKVVEARSTLSVDLLEAEAVWSAEALKAAITGLDQTSWELWFHLSIYLSSFTRGERDHAYWSKVPDHERERITLEAVVDGMATDGHRDQDWFSIKVQSVVKQFEDALRPHLQSRQR